MAIMTSAIAGCCAAQNYYALGGQHGHTRAKNQVQFDLWLRQKGIKQVNICLTNSYQKPERTFLEAAGFTRTDVDGYISVHSIDGAKLRRYLQSRDAEINAFLKQQDEAKLQKKLRFARPATNVYQGLVRELDVRRLVQHRTLGLMTPQERGQAAARLNQFYTGVNLTEAALFGETFWSLRQKIYRRLHRLRRGF